MYVFRDTQSRRLQVVPFRDARGSQPDARSDQTEQELGPWHLSSRFPGCSYHQKPSLHASQVFLYSITGFNIRVLQVHLDPLARRLCVRKTPYMQITGDHEVKKINLVLRWLMNVPTGQTLLQSLIGEQDRSREDEHAGFPSPQKRAVRCRA